MAVRKPEVQAKTKSELVQALDRLARFMTGRDHSRYELKNKLLRSFESELVEQVLDEASLRGWLSSDSAVAERAVLIYERQNKSRAYIEAQLRKRGLPLPVNPPANETAKIRQLVERKFGVQENWTAQERSRILRFLQYRGFAEDPIRQVLKNEE